DGEGDTDAGDDMSLARELSERGEIYVVSKYDDKAPVPVFIDKTKDVFTPVVGYQAARAADFPQIGEPKPPTGFFAAIANWWSNLVSGEPSQAMKDYQAAKVKYEESMAYASMLKTIKENRVPKAVQDRLDKVAAFNKKCAEDDQNLRDEVVETAIFLNQIPEDKLTNEIFCNALATMLVDKALLDRDEFGFRNRMFEMIDPLADDFDREKAIEKLANSERFAEFAWDLRRKDPELAANLGSDDAEDIEESLDEISDRFLKVFRYSNAMTGSAGAEYEIEKKRLEEIADKGSKLVDGDILKPNEYARMKESFDNKAQWDSIIAFYGSKRPFHPEWTKLGNGSVYTVKDWSYMQGSDFDLAELTPDGKEIDEHTFASLGMMLSIKHPDFFKDNPDFNNLPSAPDSMSFEDIILNGDYPRANNRVIIHPIVEPVRGMLMDDLDDFDGYGKRDLANHLTEKLKLFIGHADHFSWTDRKHGVFAEVADNVMKFVKEHDMLDMLKSAGLEDTDIEKIETFIAMGKVVKDGFDAECRLMQDHKKDPALTEEQRKECLDKIMLLKALQADVGASQKEIEVVEPMRPVRPKTEDPAALAEYEKQREAWKKEYQEFQHNLNKQMTDGTLSTFEFSPIAKDIPNGGTFLKDLADRMMPEEQRIKLAKEGTVAIVDKVQAKGDDALSGKWTKYLKENVAEENRRRMDIRTGQLNKDAEVHKNEPAAKAGEPHLENAKPEVQKSDAGMGLGK
ncbi:MAG: hypothetical protein MJ186_04325, partial [Clostridia bacterium]|nr:hypothetical protein [Clostridia bacterium]